MAISPLAVGDTGAQLLAKMNEAIAKANLVDTKADIDHVDDVASGLSAESIARGEGDASLAQRADAADTAIGGLDAALTASTSGRGWLGRPGELPDRFSQQLTGDPGGRTPLAVGTVVQSDAMGSVLRIAGGDVDGDTGYISIGPRAAFAIEIGRIYRLRARFARSSDPVDPAGNGVELRAQNLTKNKAAISNVRMGAVYYPTVSGGPIEVVLLIGSDAENVTLNYVVPATTRYFTPAIRIYGNGQSTDFAVLEWDDVTGLTLGGADIEALTTAVNTVVDAAAGSADAAASSADTSTTQAAISTTQAGISTDKAQVATDQAEIAIAAQEAAAAVVAGSFPRVDLTALKALNTAFLKNAYRSDPNRSGIFAFLAGNYSAQIAADTAEINYVKADDTAATAGAWVRVKQGGPLEVASSRKLPVGYRTLPPGFNNTIGVKVYCDGTRYQFVVKPYDLIDFTKFEAYTEYWVDYATGSDTNDGLSAGAPFKTFDKFVAVQAASGANSVVHLKDDIVGYLSKGASSEQALNGKVKIIGEGQSGRTIFAAMRESYDAAFFGFTAYGSDGTYVTTALAAGDFYRAQFDQKYLDIYGIPTPITVSSGAGAPGTGNVAAGTAYWDTTNNDLYIHMQDGRKPDPADGWLYTRSAYRSGFQQQQTTAAGVILFENCDAMNNTGTASGAAFRYRPVTTGSVNGARVGFKNCRTYGAAGNGFEIYDADVIVMENCHTAWCHVDGFNYHSFIGTGTRGEYMTVYEYDCVARECGYAGWADQAALSTSANGSTAHDSLHILRVNGSYAECNGSVMADVNGVHSVGFGLGVGKPKGTAAPKACFWHDRYLASGTYGYMYLEGCYAFDTDDASTLLFSDAAQSGGSSNNGRIHVAHWQGQTDGRVAATLLDWAGTAL